MVFNATGGLWCLSCICSHTCRLAGLAAARQLKNWGYSVVVLEGRDRPGGRVDSKRLEVSLLLFFNKMWARGLSYEWWCSSATLLIVGSDSW